MYQFGFERRFPRGVEAATRSGYRMMSFAFCFTSLLNISFRASFFLNMTPAYYEEKRLPKLSNISKERSFFIPKASDTGKMVEITDINSYTLYTFSRFQLIHVVA